MLRDQGVEFSTYTAYATSHGGETFPSESKEEKMLLQFWAFDPGGKCSPESE